MAAPQQHQPSGSVPGGAGSSCVSDPFGVFVPVPQVSDAGAAALLARALAEPPGPGRLALLVKIDGALLGPADRVDFMVAWQECVSWATAKGELCVALVAGPSPDDEGKRETSSKPTGLVVEDERCATVGAALRMTPYSAKQRMEDARSATDDYAEVTARVLAGVWTRLHLWHTGSACSGHAQHVVRLAIGNVCAVPGSELWTPTQLGRRLRAELVRLDSHVITDRIRRRKHRRSARLDPADDFHGTITVEAAWPTIAWAYGVFRRWARHERARLRQIRTQDPTARFCCPQAMARLLAHTRNNSDGDSGGDIGDADGSGSGSGGREGGPAHDGAEGTPGSPDDVDEDAPVLGPEDPCPFCGQPDTGIPDASALTADAVIAAAALLAAQLGDASAEVRPTRAKTMAIVVVDLPTAVHLADNPGYVPRYGHVPAPIAREMLADAEVWRRFLLDTSGALADTGACAYRPSDKLREHVRARDWTCTFPGCNQPAAEADLDHLDNYNGTNTTAANLHALCRRHHRIKTHTGWTPKRQPDGSTTWTSPDGHLYTNTVDTPWASFTQPNRDAAGKPPGAGAGAGAGTRTGPGAGAGACRNFRFDLQTLHTGQIIITYPNEPDGPAVPASPGNGPNGGAGSANQGSAPERPVDGAEPTHSPAARRYLDHGPPQPAVDPPAPTAIHWPTAPYSPAEAALVNLITDHTPPGRAP